MGIYKLCKLTDGDQSLRLCILLIIFIALLFFFAGDTLYATSELIAVVATNAGTSVDTTVHYRVPSDDGRLFIKISNPDTSADGMFIINVRDSSSGTSISYNEFCTTGIVPWGSRFYHSNPTAGLAYPEYEMSLTSRDYRTPPPAGTPIQIRITYPYGSYYGTEHTGMDTLFLYFNDRPIPLDTVGAILLDSLVTGPFDRSHHDYTFYTDCGMKLIAQVTQWGNHGGGDSYYIDGLGCGGTYTGSPAACEFYTFLIPNGPGSHTLTIAHEDDYWGDNIDTRAVKIFLMPLDPTIDSVWFSEETECNDSNVVQICYTLSGCPAEVTVEMSDNGGRSWDMPLTTLMDYEDDLGENVPIGNHCFLWVMNEDIAPVERLDFMLRANAIVESVSTADTTGPLDSHPPIINIECPPEFNSSGDTLKTHWNIEDLFYVNHPTQLDIHCCDHDTSITTTDTLFNWIVPDMDECPGCTLVVAVRDSFCNWGYDTCFFSISPEAPILTLTVEADTLSCLPDGHITPNPMDVRAIITNEGIREVDSVGVQINLDRTCFTIRSGDNPQKLYRISPSHSDTANWQLSINELCADTTDCVNVELIYFTR